DYLARQAGTDELTQLPNRRQFLDAAGRAVVHARSTGGPLCVALMDLDDFKCVNDKYGHALGDRCLATAATALREALRGDDVVARFGGDEFVVLLTDVELAQASIGLERVRADLRERVLWHEGESFSVTGSFGIAELLPGETLDDLLARADAGMYAAKRKGGDAVEAITEPPGITGRAAIPGPAGPAG
ncbi:MAG: GGDEF domain-containing protein, partial [Candidatus Nanopelagicales bacterium]